MVGTSGRRMLLAESASVGGVALARVCSVAKIDLVITGSEADDTTLATLRDCGVRAGQIGRQ